MNYNQQSNQFNIFLIYICIALVTLFLLSGCRKNLQRDVEFEQLDMGLNRSLINSNDYTLTGVPDETEGNIRAKTISPKISIPDNVSFLYTINQNIDADATDEQIIVVKEGDGINARFKILIADYIPVFEYYALTSEGSTQATNVQSFQVSLINVTGDANLEIVCTGYNQNDGQTMDIFKYDPGSLMSGLKFYNILRLSSSGSLEFINRQQNGSSSTGVSLQIERLQDDSDSDFIYKELYAWESVPTGDQVMGQYKLRFRDKLKKKKVNDTKLRSIIQSRKKTDKLNYLKGQWMRQSVDKNQPLYLFFDFYDDKGTINIFSDNLRIEGESNMENFNYMSYHRSLSNRILLRGINELHKFKNIKLYITFMTIDSMRVDIYDNDSPLANLKPNSERSGIFRRISDDEMQRMAEISISPTSILPEISGMYKQTLGKQYLFEYPYFKIINSNNEVTNGGYAIYQSDVPVMEMVSFDELGMVVDSRCYRFSYIESKMERKLFRTITLYPGKMTVHGFKENLKDPLILENNEFSVDEKDK